MQGEHHAYAHTHTNTHTDANTHANTHANTNTDTNTNTSAYLRQSTDNYDEFELSHRFYGHFYPYSNI